MGVIGDLDMLAKIQINPYLGAIAVLDRPLSLALDTAMVPIDLVLWLVIGESED